MALTPVAHAQENAAETVLDPYALTEMVQGFLNERGIPTERVGIGFCYLETGEEWFYNGDTWFYPASMYKVPLMMALAERVSTGELDQDGDFEGMPLSTVEEYILTYSNNDWAHIVRSYLGGDAVWRAETMQYADLPEDYYDSDFIEYGYFSPRYMTKVLETLYNEPERFPNVTACLMNAQLGHYFRLDGVNDPYDVAQKYGSFCDDWGRNWNCNAGIIYTPHPIILTVMTLDAPSYEWVIGRFALLFKDYALSLEEKLPAVEEAIEERKAEEAAAEAEEAEKAAAEQREAERRAAEIAAQQEADRLAAAAARQRQRTVLLVGIAAAALILAVLVAVLVARMRKRRRFAEYERRFREELRQEELARRRGGRP